MQFLALTRDGRRVEMGQTAAATEISHLQIDLRPGDLPIEVRLLRAGQVILTTSKSSLRYQQPVPGVYRVEVWVRLPGFWGGQHLMPLIYSNPIRIIS